MLGKNPLQVQSAPAGQFRRPTPLVLIHDGGGTTFGYFSLGSLRRDVWAIHNPHFFTSEPWLGGMEEMAQHYIDLIEEAGITGPILLGGWSLGGYLSVAIAGMLTARSSANLSVIGLLLIDSPYHIPRSQLPPSEARPDLDHLPHLVKKCLDDCDDLLHTWELPSWDVPAYEGRTASISVGIDKFVVHDGSVLYKPLQEGWRVLEAPTYKHEDYPEKPKAPPPAVMLRCIKPAPSKVSTSEPCRVDMFREDPLLGWAGKYPNFIKAVVDSDSDHYKLFELARAHEVTKQLHACLDILEQLKAV